MVSAANGQDGPVTFVKIDRADVPVVTGIRGSLSPLASALLAGDTVFIARTVNRNPTASLSASLGKRGFQIHTRAMTRDGVAGYAAWAEKIEP